jgi:CheY-like chemotaxis protein
LDNAIKFTRQGWIKLRVYQGACPTHIFFEVSDTGLGIAPEEKHLLFDPFAQTESGRKSMQGSGLGLPICKQFVNLLGGEFTVESDVGKGSIFRFDLTLRLSEAIATPISYQEKRIIGLEPGQPHYRILIVEDVEENRLLLFKLLSPLGFEIRAVNNGQEAIETWKIWQPHLIWMDILMPVMDGYDATKQIRALSGGTDVVIIALTANAFSDARHAALSVGCNDYLPKPYQEGQIFALMAKHLALRYCYGTETLAKHNFKESKFILNTQALTVMPKSWLMELQTAALGMEEERLAELIADIPPDHHYLAQNLTYLVENFRLDLILDLTHGDD